MAENSSFLTRIVDAMPWKGPNRDVVPESDDAPEIGNILVQSEGSFVIPGDYLVGNDDTIR